MSRGAAPADRPDDLVAALEADLAALAAAESDLERDAEVAERTRIERTALTLADRLRGAAGPVELAVAGGGRTAGSVVEVGDGWVLVSPGPDLGHAVASEHLVPLTGILTARGLGRAVVPSGPWTGRSLTSVLRAWCRDRSEVTARLVDGTVVRGLASAAYADHLEIATGGGSLAVALPALAVVSR
jgi:hypothetical protein